MLLRADASYPMGYKVLHADDGARQMLRIEGREIALEAGMQHDAEVLVTSIARAAAASRLSVAREQCQTDGRWYDISAGRHGDAVIVLIEDTTQRQLAEQRLRQAAYSDPVTGLANRVLLEQRLEELMTQSRERTNAPFAVLCLDFDNFKSVNDRYGHHAGDDLLVSIGFRIASAVEQEEEQINVDILAARWGGDEFVVVAPFASGTQAESFAERLREALAAPHTVEGQRIVSTVSIGVAMSTGEHETGLDVMRDADAAMYEAKQSGRNCVRFDPKLLNSPLYRIEPDAEKNTTEEPGRPRSEVA